MLTRRNPQRSLFNSDNQFLKFVGEDTIYGFLAEHRDELFSDDDFASLYCLNNGRPSVPPSMLAISLLLQTYECVSDEEASQRAQYDLRWKVALGIAVDEKPFAKSTLQLFRAQLIVHGKAKTIFEQSVNYARKHGLFKNKKIKLALDTTPIFGKGAVKDTYNLLADGISHLMNTLSRLDNTKVDVWSQQHDLRRYCAPSIKGTAEIQWDNAEQRELFLRSIVVDADRLLVLARQSRSRYVEGSVEDIAIVKSATLLSQLLVQDIQRNEHGEIKLTQGVARDRMMSVSDPEMRHGRKSKSQRFNGHKAAIAVDSQTQLITAVTVLAGNAHDHTDAMALVNESEAITQAEVELTIGDCAYGDGATRQTFQQAERVLVAKSPRQRVIEGRFSKVEFIIDTTNDTVRCPNEVVTTKWRHGATTPSGQRYKNFIFSKSHCRVCPLAARCVKHPGKDQKTICVHPQEEILQKSREYQTTSEFKLLYKLRQVAEHRIAQLVQLGIREAKYFGRKKTLFQLLIASTVANLTLVASWMSNSFIFLLTIWDFVLTRLVIFVKIVHRVHRTGFYTFSQIADQLFFGFSKNRGFRLNF